MTLGKDYICGGMKRLFSITILFAALLVSALSCTKETQAMAEDPCAAVRSEPTIGVITSQEGIIRDASGTYYIEMNGNTLIPCSLPAAFQEAGLSVIVSADIKITQQDAWTGALHHRVYITAISRK